MSNSKIPEKYCKRNINKPRAYTVKELRKLLKQLPNNLPIEQGFEGGVMLIVYNVSRGNPHLEFIEVEGWEKDE